MTSLSLLLWIVAAILLQLLIYLGIVYWRHWLNYQALPNRGKALRLLVGQDKSGCVEETAVAAWLGFRPFRVDCKVVENIDRSICSFYLVPEDGQPLPPFLPGQFLTFRLNVPTALGVTAQVIRCYSLSEAPRPDCYRVTIKRVPPPTGSDFPPGLSSNYFHNHVAVGGILQARAPSGHFHIDDTDVPVVLIGGGIGITPMLSILDWCLDNRPGREVWLFYGVRNGLEAVMKSHLEGLALSRPNFHLWVCFSAALPEDVAGRDYCHEGRIDISLVQAQLPPKPYHFYICGPTAMLESFVPALEDWGVPDTHIHFEAFGPASIKRRTTKASVAAAQDRSADTAFLVNFAKSGKQLHWQPSANNLLEFAEANGITVNSGCRAGCCGTCQTKIQSGEVAYLQPPDYDPEPGFCLPCVCSPKTNVTLEA